MKGMKKLNLLQLLLLLKIFIPTSQSQQIPVSYCGKIRLKSPLFHENASQSSLLRNMVLCKSDQLYFRTTIGLFPISSIDYTNKLLTVSHASCSPTSDFLSPHHISAGFPTPSTTPNSLLVFNCSKQSSKTMFLPCNDTRLSGCHGLAKGFSSCSVVDDLGKLEKDFDPKEMNCTHYRRVYRSSVEKFEVGTKISFDIPDHVPNPCNQCGKSDGNCGAGLRCVCHPKKCKDKVISVGAVVKPRDNMLFYLLLFIVLIMGMFQGF